MFSGIIEDVGVIKKLIKSVNGMRLLVKSPKVADTSEAGDSISVNGACLSVTGVSAGVLEFDMTPETLRATTFSNASAGDAVNLEKALKAGARVSGHFVTGHVDCAGIVNYAKKSGAGRAIRIEVPEGAAYLADKGSVAVDGVSLTIAESEGNFFTASLIPLTLRMTSLGMKKKGDKVNIEFDILAKYALRDAKGSAPLSGGIDEEFLRRHGFA